jgi:NAD(P)-dependent dehydrogenase (short-subunit alcohol dehydrogenase family)
MLRFDGRVVLITGAGRGIGRQHALFLASRGASVVVNDFGGDRFGQGGNDASPAESVAAQIRSCGGTAMAACADIGDRAQVDAMFASAVERFGRIDVLIHNASVYSRLGPFAQAQVEDLERILRVNAVGGWNVAQAAWKVMSARSYGRIVMTGSGAGFFGRRNDHAYSVAKSALMGFTKGLATEGSTLGIKVNLVGPVAWTDNAALQSMPALMERFAPPIMVSNLVAVLAHADCPVTGEMFHCGGGFIAKVFIGETQGLAFEAQAMSPESVLQSLDRIRDESGYATPGNSDRSGAHLSAAIAAINPEFAAALAAARQDRDRGRNS